MDNLEKIIEVQEQIVTDNRDFIVKHLDADDLIDELIQERLLGRSGAQRVQLPGTSREEKNRIICEQLTTAGPDALKEFCKILRKNKRQTFIAERLEKCLHTAIIQCTSGRPTVKSSPIDIEMLQARYLHQPPTSKSGWPKHCVIQYVRLALVEKEDVTIKDEKLNEITKLSLQGEVDKILKKKVPLGDLKEIFNKPCPRLLLIMGAPGIGKTTLANEICVKWAREGFLTKEFDVVLLIPLRSAQGRSVEEVVLRHVGEDEAYKEIKKSRGERCLIILEGLDEIAMERQKTDDFLVRVITEGTLLEKATILITSRPHACKDVQAGRTVEIIGFGHAEVKKFAEIFFADVETVEEFLLQLSQFPHIRSLCYIPMNLVMILDIFQVNKKLPSTLTELYQFFTVMILQRQIKKGSEIKPFCSLITKPAANEEQLHKLLKGVPTEAMTTVFLLANLAYCSFFDWYSNMEEMKYSTRTRKWKDPKIIFTTEDLTQCGIEVTADWDGYGLLKATPTHDVPVDTVTYNFAHLTIQEFLCALYISTLVDQDQEHLLSKHFKDYPNVFIFLCGLTRLVSPATSQYVCKMLQDGDDGAVTAAKCVYEAQQTSAPQSVGPFGVNFSPTSLQPYDCLCVSYVLSCYPLNKLDMTLCHIGDTGVEMLIKHYPEKNITGHVLQELILYHNDLTVTGLGHVMKIVRKSSASLRVLCVGGNPISDDGISLMVDHLYHNTTLNELDVRLCGLSAKSASCVGRFLKNCNLQVLDMSDNHISDDGISLLVEGLQCNKTITKLDVRKCGLSVKGASCVGRFLKNCNLQVLDMKGNHISDDGMSLLVEGLLCNKTLTRLDVRSCGLSVEGARCIGELLQVNNVLQVLWMGRNNISDDGISVIAGALGKSRIRELSVSDCGITDTGAKQLATGLSLNSSITVLTVWNNPITVEGARLILQSAVNNKVCTLVKIDDKHKTDSEVRRMSNILETRQKAKNKSRSTDDGEDKGFTT